jgi:5-methylcytosine-specific restriction endonuclease McrA
MKLWKIFFKNRSIFPAEVPVIVPFTKTDIPKAEYKRELNKKKKRIPAALREQVWIQKAGRVFETKCKTTWCQNMITVFDFQCGHNIPESKGGETNLDNLEPICGRCNLSMSNVYTFTDWCSIHKSNKSIVKSVTCTSCFSKM